MKLKLPPLKNASRLQVKVIYSQGVELGYSVNKDFIYAVISVLFYLLHTTKILRTFALDLRINSFPTHTLYIVRKSVG